ncbi:hypothetical protein FYL25_06400 [Lactobacillus salivarius]|uniref:Uncharacterized protein n=1 Tax=Ligilactobacillus salivarius TaxID=1624 RepID=A0A6N9IRT7_9LACO|nr:hypothetical protein [Ligilactobacillus salivarius]
MLFKAKLLVFLLYLSDYRHKFCDRIIFYAHKKDRSIIRPNRRRVTSPYGNFNTTTYYTDPTGDRKLVV